jgi:Cof subfamily protein (haloacid dehalogenase superfamily)
MINRHCKLLVLDIDGTLLNKQGTISEIDRQALTDTLDAGIIVSLCTGRVTRACQGILTQLSLDGFHIFFDGALVCDPVQNREIYSKSIDPRLVRKASEAALSCGVQIEFFSAAQYFTDKESWRTRLRQTFFGTSPTIVDYRALWQSNENIIKGGIIVRSHQEDLKIKQFTSLVQDSLGITWTRTPVFPDLAFINITALGVSKGKALEALASYLGIALSEVVAIGDGTNDIALLSTAGLAIAMQNAPNKLKAVAHHVTADVEHSGVAQAIRRYIL